MSDPSPTTPQTGSKALVCFGIFAIFFTFYVGAALVQSPMGKNIAEIPVLGLPLGLLLSLMVFPLSWVLIAIWFWKVR
ncbi:MAG: hypothetical protein PF961_13530 [Planctomycetota bacterium]|jgi:hypothetical protein|nr:hypothetical protein [Planctomycetota bacterium]